VGIVTGHKTDNAVLSQPVNAVPFRAVRYASACYAHVKIDVEYALFHIVMAAFDWK
jgi:hypothetical protein